MRKKVSSVLDWDDLPPVLTVLEAAKLLRISRNHCYRLANLGELPSLRLGRKLVFPKSALLRLLAGAEDGRLAG